MRKNRFSGYNSNWQKLQFDATTAILPDNDALYNIKYMDMAKEGNMLMEETGDPESLR